MRQLRTLVHRLVVFADDETITPDVLRSVALSELRPEHRAAPAVARRGARRDPGDVDRHKLDAVIAGLVDEAVRRTDGNKSAAARCSAAPKALDVAHRNGPRGGS